MLTHVTKVVHLLRARIVTVGVMVTSAHAIVTVKEVRTLMEASQVLGALVSSAHVAEVVHMFSTKWRGRDLVQMLWVLRRIW